MLGKAINGVVRHRLAHPTGKGGTLVPTFEVELSRTLFEGPSWQSLRISSFSFCLEPLLLPPGFLDEEGGYFASSANIDRQSRYVCATACSRLGRACEAQRPRLNFIANPLSIAK